MTERQQFLETWEREFQKTLKVLNSYPANKSDLQPHPKCRPANELAWAVVFEEEFFSTTAASGKLELPSPPAAPASVREVSGRYQENHSRNVEKIKKMTDAEFEQKMKFLVGPNKMEDVRRADILWLMMMDTIHHRGQFSIYLRMADGKVPSIYGPSGDEPWR